jgi:hypothetical protein
LNWTAAWSEKCDPYLLQKWASWCGIAQLLIEGPRAVQPRGVEDPLTRVAYWGVGGCGARPWYDGAGSLADVRYEPPSSSQPWGIVSPISRKTNDFWQ